MFDFAETVPRFGIRESSMSEEPSVIISQWLPITDGVVAVFSTILIREVLL